MVYVEKPVVVEKRIIVEKPVVVERPIVVEKHVPVPRTVSACKGIRSPTACANLSGCQWIRHKSSKNKHGGPLTDYCRSRATASARK